MRVLVVFCHPNPESYCAALHAEVVTSLKAGGHEVDDCDLYAEGFEPVMSRAERVGYHDLASNTLPVQAYVDRLRAAEALVLVHPVWNFGFPAMMKGFFDRVFLPGVSFGMVEGRARGSLTNIKRVVIVTTYGATPWRAFMAGDPPKRFAKRVMRAMTQMKAPVGYLAHYDMNRSTPATRADFLQKVRDCFRSF